MNIHNLYTQILDRKSATLRLSNIAGFFIAIGLVFTLSIGQVQVALASDTLDFADFKDAMVLDDSTSLDLGAFDFSTSGSGGLDFGHSGGTRFGSDVEVGTSEGKLTKLNNPPTQSSGYVISRSFTNDGRYMAVGTSGSHGNSCVVMYERNGSTYTDVTSAIFDNPPQLSSCYSTYVEFSPNGSYLIISANYTSSNKVFIYKWVNGEYVYKQSFHAGSIISGGTLSADAEYLALALQGNPYLRIYKRTGDSFSELPSPSTLPPGVAQSIDFSNDGAYLAVGHWYAPNITIYKRAGDSFTKLDDPTVLPTNGGMAVKFSPNGEHLAVGHDDATIYKRSGSTFEKLVDLEVVPNDTVTVREITYSPDGQYLALGYQSLISPYFYTYEIDGDQYTKLPDPVDLPDGMIALASIEYSPDSSELFVSHQGSWEVDRVVWYKVSGAAGLSVNGSVDINNGLHVSGLSSTFDTNLIVNGASNLTRDVTIGTDDYAAGLSVKGALEAGGALTIGGNALFNGLTTFTGQAEFVGSALFKDDVMFEKDVGVVGKLKVSSNNAGRQTIEPGQQYIGVGYPIPGFASKPVVSGILAEVNMTQSLYDDYVATGKCTTIEGLSGCRQKIRDYIYAMEYTIIQQTTSSFQIALKESSDYKMEFNWMALEVAQ